jgi:hypothetical protein
MAQVLNRAGKEMTRTINIIPTDGTAIEGMIALPYIDIFTYGPTRK